MANLRSGDRWKKMADQFKHRCKIARLPCHLCGQPIDYTLKTGPQAFQVDHYHPISQRPDLVYDQRWFRPSHATCNNHRGDKPIQPQPWVAANW